jgi:hypothetical protein
MYCPHFMSYISEFHKYNKIGLLCKILLIYSVKGVI